MIELLFVPISELSVLLYYFSLFTVPGIIPTTVYLINHLIRHHCIPNLLIIENDLELNPNQKKVTHFFFGIYLVSFLATFILVLSFLFILDMIVGTISQLDLISLLLGINTFFIIASATIVYDMYFWTLERIYDETQKLDHDTMKAELYKKFQGVLICDGIIALLPAMLAFICSKWLFS